MMRGNLFRGVQLRCRVAHRFITPIVTACPYGYGSATPTQTATDMGMAGMEHCPVVGTTPPAHCPLEFDVNDVVMKQPSLMNIASKMGKSQLSAYVAATALAGYVIAGGTNPLFATIVTAGTMLQSCSANTANQIIEVPYDAMMKRTCRRPLPMKQITPQGAIMLSATELAIGTGMLYCVSPAAAALGCVNWFLYVGMYTPLKRISPLNTWFGSIVGGVPPLMGGLVASPVIGGPVVLLATLLFIWQIPHFHGLAFHCRRDYEAAGYKMLAYSHPWRASFYAVLLSVFMAVLTLAGPSIVEMPVEGVWYYPVAAAANAVMIYKSLLFHQSPQQHCRGCFVFSYVYLSIMLAAIMLSYVQPVHRVNSAIAYLSGETEEAEDTVCASANTA